MSRLSNIGRLAIGISAALGWTMAMGQTSTVLPVLTPEDFELIVEQGFGDEQNSMSWSSKWWNGKLYVGTLRCNYCVQQATFARWVPSFWFVYPPSDPEFDCTESPQDLPVRGEIWRWSPEDPAPESPDPAPGLWERVFHSPEDAQTALHPDRQFALDIGFRTMSLYTEDDGTEALYIGGVSSEPYNPGVPLARLLRTTDGENFEPVPQDPGTFLGELTIVEGLPFNGYRSLQAYTNKDDVNYLFGVASWGFAGHGSLIASANPKGGNDEFHFAAPFDQAFYQLASYNGYLIAGTAAIEGFEVVKTDAYGSPPYDFETVIPGGGYLRRDPSAAVVSLFEYKDRLYVGTDRPAEIYRINPDDSWELIAGEPRPTPDGMVHPLSGLGAGFDNKYNIHIWRMQDAWGTLYTGTMDQTTKWWGVESLYPVAGFDLFATRNGYYYTMVTRSGLLETPEIGKYDIGLRQFAFSEDHGLIVGSANNYFGTNVWRALPNADRPRPPEQLEVQPMEDGSVVLSWNNASGASAYHVYRSLVDSEDREFYKLGTTTGRFYQDNNADADYVAHYYVVADYGSNRLSGPSNTARTPFIGERTTFLSMRRHLTEWQAKPDLLDELRAARVQYLRNKYDTSVSKLRALQAHIENQPDALTPDWRNEDAIVLLARLIRQVELAQAGLL